MAIDVHPELARFRERIAARRSELAALIEEETAIREHEIPNMLAEYDVRLGRLECELLRLQVENATKRRRFELVVAKLNRGEELGRQAKAEIERVIAVELADWNAKLAQREHEVRQRLAWKQDPSTQTADEARRCKTLYRQLCRTLHPDVTGKPSEAHARYWDEVQRAYAQGDVERLAAIADVVGQPIEPPASAPDAIDLASAELTRLGVVLERQLERIRKLREEPPLCWAAQLADAEWVASKQKELRDSIEGERTRARGLDAELAALEERPAEVH